MLKFTKHLEQGISASSGLAIFGYSVKDMFIEDPYLSECGRFIVADPQEAYGLSKQDSDQLIALNKVLDDATRAALNAGCKTVQDALGITSGDQAGLFFSDTSNEIAVSKAMADYILHELGAADLLSD